MDWTCAAEPVWELFGNRLIHSIIMATKARIDPAGWSSELGGCASTPPSFPRRLRRRWSPQIFLLTVYSVCLLSQRRCFIFVSMQLEGFPTAWRCDDNSRGFFLCFFCGGDCFMNTCSRSEPCEKKNGTSFKTGMVCYILMRVINDFV